MIKIYRESEGLDKVFSRSQLNDSSLIESVRTIVEDVQIRGDIALMEYVGKFDGGQTILDTLVINKESLQSYVDILDSNLKDSLIAAIENVRDYHSRQADTYKDVIYTKGESKLGWMYKPLNRVGVYVPGGKAIYPSSVIMCALPAIVAGVKEVVVATPNPNPITLAAAALCGVDKVYAMGGAHSISALAFGTDKVSKVDLIAGPGNIYVTLAKKLVYGNVGIDMIAGPSEILVIADDSANPEYVAADLLSQAEHDEMAASILITTSESLAIKVKECIVSQVAKLSRKDIISKSLANNGAIIITQSIERAIEISDRIAPEHLEICTIDAAKVAMKITNAGAVFVGNYSPEPLGDYFAGPSHCLPTSGSARYFNVLNIETFMRKTSYIEYSKHDLLNCGDKVIAIGEAEGLTAHANTIKVRMKEKV